MSNTQTIPARINGKRNNEYHKEYNRKYRETQDPIKKREANRRTSKKYRENHRQEWREYFGEYFKNWYKLNKRTHSLRSKTSNIKVGLLAGAKFGYENTTIYENLKSVGWSENLPETQCIQHKISIYWFIQFNKDIPALVVFDRDNLEVILKVENNSAKYREVTNELIELASRLEAKYPKELSGFTCFLSKQRGIIK